MHTRYYGTSLPFGPATFTAPPGAGLLQFLTMEQALADYAVLIDFIKSTVPGTATSAVIAFGGSYGGAWLCGGASQGSGGWVGWRGLASVIGS